MPKYRIIHYYISAITFEVEADSPDQASRKLDTEADIKQFWTGETSPEFCDEMIEEL